MGAHDPSISRYTKDVNIDNSGHLILSQPTTPVKTLTPEPLTMFLPVIHYLMEKELL